MGSLSQLPAHCTVRSYASPHLRITAYDPFSEPCLWDLLPCLKFSLYTCLSRLLATSLVGLVDCFFNSLAVIVPRSLIFWHFWLFIVFRLVVGLFLVVRVSEGFLPRPSSWPELPQLLNFVIFCSEDVCHLPLLSVPLFDVLIYLIFCCLCYYSCPNFSSFPPLTSPSTHSRQPPHHCPCPWVIPTCFLTISFTFFQPLPTPHLQMSV